MKLVRVGEVGKERPAIVDEQGQLRDLSQYIDDIAGEQLLPASLDKLRHLALN